MLVANFLEPDHASFDAGGLGSVLPGVVWGLSVGALGFSAKNMKFLFRDRIVDFGYWDVGLILVYAEVNYISDLQLLAPAAFLAHRTEQRLMAALQQVGFRVGHNCVSVGMLVLAVYDPFGEAGCHTLAFFRVGLGLFVCKGGYGQHTQCQNEKSQTASARVPGCRSCCIA